MKIVRNARILLCAASLALALTACAHSYVDKDGGTHVIGFAHVIIPKSTDTREVRAESVRIKSFGLTVLANYEHTIS